MRSWFNISIWRFCSCRKGRTGDMLPHPAHAPTAGVPQIGVRPAADPTRQGTGHRRCCWSRTPSPRTNLQPAKPGPRRRFLLKPWLRISGLKVSHSSSGCSMATVGRTRRVNTSTAAIIERLLIRLPTNSFTVGLPPLQRHSPLPVRSLMVMVTPSSTRPLRNIGEGHSAPFNESHSSLPFSATETA